VLPGRITSGGRLYLEEVDNLTGSEGQYPAIPHVQEVTLSASERSALLSHRVCLYHFARLSGAFEAPLPSDHTSGPPGALSGWPRPGPSG
jgi:hypothetical protein